MAESYILNVKPTISNSDGRKMETDLNKRFSRVAQKFGGALKTVGSKLKGILAGSAIAGLGAVLTNPFDQLSQSIDDNLKKYDDISARAKQLGISSGQLYQATEIAKSAGIEEDDFRSMLGAFAVKIGEAKKGDDPMLSEFANEDNLAEGFFKMVKSLQHLKPDEQMYYASKILGEDDAIKLAELINTDIGARKQQIFGNTSTEETTKAIERMSDLEGEQAIMRSQSRFDDLMKKSQLITSETLQNQNQVAEKRRELENSQLGSFDAFAKMQIATEESKVILADIQQRIAPLVEQGVGILEKSYNGLKNSKFAKWMGGVFK